MNRGVRRTSSQATSARRRLWPLRRLRSSDDGTQPARRARSGLRFAVSATTVGPSVTGLGAGSSIARGVEATTILTVSAVQARADVRAVDAELAQDAHPAGLAMSTSVSSVPLPPEEITRMRLPCASISAPEPRIVTELRRRGVGLRASTAVSCPPSARRRSCRRT